MLPPPGNVKPMSEDTGAELPSPATKQADEAPAEVILQDDTAAPEVNGGFQAGQDDDEEAAVVITDTAVGAGDPPPLPGTQEATTSAPPPPPGSEAETEAADLTPPETTAQAGPETAASTPPPPSATEPPPPATIANNQAPATTTAAAVPAPAGVNANKISKALVDAGFEGLELGFGAFPMVTLQNTEFSTSDGISLGHEFFAVIHSSRKKYLLKANRGRDEEEFTYSYDKITTIGGKSVDEVKQEWVRQGYDSPEWKEYLDVTAQLIDIQKKVIGQMVLLSIPHSSNARLSGYITTLLTSGTPPSDVVTHVHLGQQVTAAKKPFYPWAFKKYALLGEVVQQ